MIGENSADRFNAEYLEAMEENFFGFDANPIFEMENGLVVIPAEAGTFALPGASGNQDWQLVTDTGGNGLGHITFTGNDLFDISQAGTTQSGPLKYTFTVTGEDAAGTYYLTLRAYRSPNAEEPERTDLNNDFWVKFGEEGEWNKSFFSGAFDQYVFGNQFQLQPEPGQEEGDNVTATLDIPGPGTYTIYIGGRSTLAGLDQIHIQKDSGNFDGAAPASAYTIDPDAPVQEFVGAILGDYKVDVDGNDQASEGDTALEGKTVTLLDAEGQVAAQTTTGPGGTYSFSDVLAGRYRIQFESDEAGPFATPDVGSAQNDSDVVETLPGGDGLTGYFEVVAGQTLSDVDALIDLNPVVEPPAPQGPGEDRSQDVVLFRVNAGGPSIEATDGGPNWEADLIDAASDSLISGGNRTSDFEAVEPGAAVPAGVPGLIFDSERSDDLGPDEQPMIYSFDLSGSRPGPFEVRLFVSSGYFESDQPGDRIFSVSVNGETPAAFTDIDPVALFGHEVGGVISAVVNVTGDTLDIQFDHGPIENPQINGIEIVEVGLLPVEVTIGAPTVAELVEDGDTGVTTLEFPIEVDAAPPGAVTVTYDVLVNGAVLATGLTAEVTADGGVALAAIPNDALFNGDEDVTVTLTGFDVGGGIAALGAAVSATGTVTEDEVNGDPVAVDDAATVGEASGVTVINVLDNDSDPDGNALSVSAIDVTGLSGAATLNADGTISYNPNGAFDALGEGETGTDTLTYTLTDEFGATSTGTVTITITGAAGSNTAPTVTPEVGGVPENSPAGTVVAVLSVAGATGGTITYTLTDAAGAPITDPVLEIVGNEIRVKAGADLDYEALRAAGDVSLDGYVVANDGNGDSAPTAFSVNVADVAEAVALGDGGETFRDTGDNEESITGGAGDDTIFGGGGDDDIDGGAGNDRMTGGTGDDVLAGGAGDDEIRGNSGDDTIRGGDGNDALYGGGGADMIFGEGGDDLLLGVTGNDQLFGGAGNDRLFGRAENDSLDGGDGDDALTGNAGDDVMIGGAGRDVLLAGGGNDVMTGGTERDVFVFQNERGEDVITDFEVGLDKISFRDRTFGDREVEFGDLEITQNGDDAVITERGLSITLNGVDASTLTESDFIF